MHLDHFQSSYHFHLTWISGCVSYLFRIHMVSRAFAIASYFFPVSLFRVFLGEEKNFLFKRTSCQVATSFLDPFWVTWSPVIEPFNRVTYKLQFIHIEINYNKSLDYTLTVKPLKSIPSSRIFVSTAIYCMYTVDCKYRCAAFNE